MQLFCLPCAGSSATSYSRWRRLLPHAWSVSPLELPGRGQLIAQPYECDFARLVARLSDAVCALRRGASGAAGSQGYALFGHSMGALLAHGVACALQRRGVEPPAALIVSACAAPSVADTRRFATYQNDLTLIEHLREYGGTDGAVFGDRDLLELALATLRADYQLLSTFRHTGQPALTMPIHVFAGRQDHITAEQLTPWSLETTHGCELHWFEGGHFFIRDCEDAVLEALCARVAHAPRHDTAVNKRSA